MFWLIHSALSYLIDFPNLRARMTFASLSDTIPSMTASCSSPSVSLSSFLAIAKTSSVSLLFGLNAYAASSNESSSPVFSKW